MVTRKVPADFICLNDENRAEPRLDKHAVTLAELIDLLVRSSIEDRSRLFDSSSDLQPGYRAALETTFYTIARAVYEFIAKNIENDIE